MMNDIILSVAGLKIVSWDGTGLWLLILRFAKGTEPCFGQG